MGLGLAWVTLVWGTGWLAIKLALESFSPLFLAGSRHVFAALILLALARAAGATAPRGRGEWSALVGSGLLMAGLCPGLVFWAQVRVPSGLASLLFAAMPLFTALLADRLLPGERLTRGRLLGIAVGLGGVSIVCAGGVDLALGTDLAPGAAALLLAALLFSGGVVWLKRSGARFHPLMTVTVQSAVGAALLVPIALALEPEPVRGPDMFGLGVYAYLVIVQSCLTQSVYVWLVKRVDATKIAFISCIVPVIAVAAGALVLGEPVGWALLAGGAGVVAGLYLVNRPGVAGARVPAPVTAAKG